MKEERGGKTSGTDGQYYLHDNTQTYREKGGFVWIILSINIIYRRLPKRVGHVKLRWFCQTDIGWGLGYSVSLKVGTGKRDDHP